MHRGQFAYSLYEFAHSLRRTGWKKVDQNFALSLWVEREFGTSPLHSYLVAGFKAGYVEEARPSADKATLESSALKQHFTKRLPH